MFNSNIELPKYFSGYYWILICIIMILLGLYARHKMRAYGEKAIKSECYKTLIKDYKGKEAVKMAKLAILLYEFVFWWFLLILVGYTIFFHKEIF